MDCRPFEDRPPRLAEFAAHAAILLCLALELALLPVGLDDMDEGYFSEQATRVLRGELPYRDFDSLYTPGLLYLHAWLFQLFGQPHLLVPRLLSFLTRVALTLGLYALGRRLAGPGWAALPAVYLLVGLDRAPLNWEPHPNWQSTLTTVAAVWLFGRLPATAGRRRIVCLLAVGALAGLAFAFKQNAGLLLVLAAAGFLLLQGADPLPRPVGPVLRAVQLLALGGVLAALVSLVLRHPRADALLLGYLLGPVVVLGLLLAWGAPLAWRGEGLVRRLGPLIALAAGFGIVTLPWLLWLVLALDGQVAYLSGFVGGLDIAPLALPIELPRGPAWSSMLGIALAGIAVVRAGRFAGGLPLLVLAGFGWALLPLTREPAESTSASLLLAPGRAAYGLQAFLPPIALWAGLWLARRRPRTADDWLLRWYVAAAAITFLVQFPRLDNFHLLWSASLPLVVGAIGLDRLHRSLARRWGLGPFGRPVLAAALLVGPALTALPNLYVRGEGFVRVDPASGVVHLASLARFDDPPALAGLLVPLADRDQLANLAAHLRATTAPDAPIFVYPTSPLVYVVANRPNPTRYAHLYPGAASPAELDGLIATLESAAVRTLVVSDGWLFVWSPPGGNARLEDYLAATYRDTARFGTYRVLTRRE